MTTLVKKTIGSTGDYATLAAWLAAIPSDLVAADQAWQGACQKQTFTLSSQLNITGKNTDPTRYIELTADTNCSFADDSSNPLRYDATKGAAIQGNVPYVGQISVGIDNVRINRLQFSGGTSVSSCIATSGDRTIDINQCILQSAKSTTINITGSGAKIRNSLLIARGTTGFTCVYIAIMDTGASAYGCTFVSPSDKSDLQLALLEASYGTAKFENCVFCSGNTATTFRGGSGGTQTYINCKSNGSSLPTGVTSCTYDTSLFANITDATANFKPVSGSALIDAGVSNADIVANCATDIFGTGRPAGGAYDVGAYEFVSGAPAAPPAKKILVKMQAVQRMIS